MLLVSKVSRFAVFLLLALTVTAQEPVEKSGTQGAMTVYDGPSILGREGSAAGVRGTDPVPVHVQASLNATYDSSILGYSVNPSGGFDSNGAEGVEATVGVSGRTQWRRSYLGIDYAGNYGHYNALSYYNGSNHQLNLGYGLQLGRKWTIMSQIGAGTSNRFVGGPSVYHSSQPDLIDTPTTELFDSRNYFISTNTSAMYAISRRQSLRFSGTGSAIRRRAQGLADMQSYGASADWVYRLSRRFSVGVSYQFYHYDFTKIFGESDVHTLGWHMSRRFGRDWDVSLSLTGSQQNTVGVRNIALDPVLAAILGRSTGTEVFESNNLLYGYSGLISRRIRRSTLSAYAQRGINAGNGYFLTSISNTGGVNFYHTVNRNTSFSGSVGYLKMTSLGFSSGDYRGWVAGGGVTRKLTESFGFNARVDWRTYDIQQTQLSRSGFRIAAGVSYFPPRGFAGLW